MSNERGLSEEKVGEEENPKQHASSSDGESSWNFPKLKEMHTLGKIKNGKLNCKTTFFLFSANCIRHYGIIIWKDIIRGPMQV